MNRCVVCSTVSMKIRISCRRFRLSYPINHPRSEVFSVSILYPSLQYIMYQGLNTASQFALFSLRASYVSSDHTPILVSSITRVLLRGLSFHCWHITPVCYIHIVDEKRPCSISRQRCCRGAKVLICKAEEGSHRVSKLHYWPTINVIAGTPFTGQPQFNSSFHRLLPFVSFRVQ